MEEGKTEMVASFDDDWLEQFIDPNIPLFQVEEEVLRGVSNRYDSDVQETFSDPHMSVLRETYQCSKCLKTFAVRSTLKRHLREQHSSREQFTCLNCFQTFPRRYLLKDHNMKCKGGSSKRKMLESPEECHPSKQIKLSDEDIDFELNNIPDEMLEDWVWPIFGFDQEGGGEEEQCA
ncbi:hypothetical protein AC249_AIPGENE28083, partial [Exaiptasia diaphana]